MQWYAICFVLPPRESSRTLPCTLRFPPQSSLAFDAPLQALKAFTLRWQSSIPPQAGPPVASSLRPCIWAILPCLKSVPFSPVPSSVEASYLAYSLKPCNKGRMNRGGGRVKMSSRCLYSTFHLPPSSFALLVLLYTLHSGFTTSSVFSKH